MQEASAVIGLMIPREKLFLEQKEQNCKCLLPEEFLKKEFEWCPICRSNLWETWDKPIGEGIYQRDRGWIKRIWGFDPKESTLLLQNGNGYKLYPKIYYGSHDEYFAGICINAIRGKCVRQALISEISDIRKDLKTNFSTLSLWDEELFGLWSISHNS